MTRIVGLLALVLGLATVVIPSVGRHGLRSKYFSEALAAEETEIIVAQIRKQGFACDQPVRQEPDRQRSKPNEAVWVLKCQNATYRVRLIPKRAAGVERVD